MRTPWIVSRGPGCRLLDRPPLPLLAALLGGWLSCGCNRSEVTVVRVERGPVESTVTSVEAGVVEPLRKANLAAPVSGRIVRIFVSEGQRVEAGATLVELENDSERLRRDEAAKEVRRLSDLGDITAREQLDRAVFALDRAQVDYDRTTVRAPFPGIVAELNARVGEVAYGNMAAAIVAGMPGQEPLVYLVDDSRLFVEAEIDESDAFRVRPGQPTRVRVGSVDRRNLSGNVVSLSATVSTKEGESRTAEVKVELLGEAARDPASPGSTPYPPSPELQNVLVGMSADVEILVDRAEDVVRVPTAVVLERGEESYVFVVLDGRLSRRTIQVGLGNWELTEVRSGVEAGELVVLPADLGDLRDGARVVVVEKEPLP